MFVHVYQNIDNNKAEWVTTDMFDADENNKIVEHWDVIAAYKEANETVSGNDMILGEFVLKDFDKTEINKACIRSFLVDVFQNKNNDALSKYVSKNEYIQHNANVPNGIEALEQFLDI